MSPLFGHALSMLYYERTQCQMLSYRPCYDTAQGIEQTFPDIHPLLGQKACLGMKIVSYLNNDELNKPTTGDTLVYLVNGTGPISIEQLIKQYPLSLVKVLVDLRANTTSGWMKVSHQSNMP